MRATSRPSIHRSLHVDNGSPEAPKAASSQQSNSPETTRAASSMHLPIPVGNQPRSGLTRPTGPSPLLAVPTRSIRNSAWNAKQKLQHHERPRASILQHDMSARKRTSKQTDSRPTSELDQLQTGPKLHCTHIPRCRRWQRFGSAETMRKKNMLRAEIMYLDKCTCQVTYLVGPRLSLHGFACRMPKVPMRTPTESVWARCPEKQHIPHCENDTANASKKAAQTRNLQRRRYH
jgi:hypothetical protein